MKKNIFFPLITGFIFLLYSCYAPNSPSAAVRNAFAAAEKGDWDKFDEYSIGGTGEFFITRSLIISRTMGFLDRYGGLKNIISETVNGNQATVKATFKKGKDYDLQLIMHDGRWKIFYKL
jgi:hypothetical protein